MNGLKFSGLYDHYYYVTRNLLKVCTANSHLHISKGTRLVKKARKYKRPEDLEDPFYHGIGPKENVTSAYQSIAARGFAKEQPSYTPPADLDEQLLKICKKIFGSQLSSDWKNQPITDPLIKYKLLTKTIQFFKKDIPSSELHKIKEVKDLHAFFSVAIDGSYHYDALVRDSNKLPPNLHIMPETPRFNPDTDTFFDGVTAFPGRKKIIYTKTGEKFEKTVDWPNI